MPSLLRSYLFDRYFNIKVDKDNTNYHLIQAGIVQDSVLGPFLYLMYTADIPTRDETDMDKFVDDTAILICYKSGCKNEKLKSTVGNQPKTKHSLFPQEAISNQPIPIKDVVKYLDLYLYHKLIWRAHIKGKKQQLNI